jgi:hypothetical protein
VPTGAAHVRPPLRRLYPLDAVAKPKRTPLSPLPCFSPSRDLALLRLLLPSARRQPRAAAPDAAIIAPSVPRHQAKLRRREEPSRPPSDKRFPPPRASPRRPPAPATLRARRRRLQHRPHATVLADLTTGSLDLFSALSSPVPLRRRFLRELTDDRPLRPRLRLREVPTEASLLAGPTNRADDHWATHLVAGAAWHDGDAGGDPDQPRPAGHGRGGAPAGCAALTPEEYNPN